MILKFAKTQAKYGVLGDFQNPEIDGFPKKTKRGQRFIQCSPNFAKARKLRAKQKGPILLVFRGLREIGGGVGGEPIRVLAVFF